LSFIDLLTYLCHHFEANLFRIINIQVSVSQLFSL
jgi:hypothetical protein